VFKCAKLATIISVAALLSACGSTPKSNSYISQFNNVNLSEREVYARLVKTEDNSYKYGGFSFDEQPNMVNLNTLTHTFNTSEAECSQSLGIMDSKTEGLCDTDSDLFRSSTIDVGDIGKNTLGNAFAGYITFGTGMSAHFSTEFDQEAFVAALHQAEMSLDRLQFVKDTNEIVRAAQQQLDSKRAKFVSNHKLLEKNLPTRIKVNDGSMLLTKKPFVRVIVTESIPVTLDMSGHWNDFKELNAKLAKSIAVNVAQGQIKLSCSGPTNFSYTVSGCDQTWGYDTPPDSRAITYTVKSKKRHLFNVTPIIEDDILRISTDNRGRLTFSNKTDKFLTIDNISLYINKDIASLTGLNLQLAPHAEKRGAMQLSDFSNYHSKTALSYIVKNDLNKVIDYGLATKYKVVDTSKEKTLYEMSSSPIGELPTR